METTLTKFKKTRTISEVLEDAFAFLQVHYLKMLKTIWTINKIHIIFFILFGFIYYFKYSQTIEEIFLSNNTANFGVNTIWGLVFTLFTLYVTARIYSSGYGYLKNYIENNGKVDIEYIQEYTNRKWWGYILLSILSVILIFLGFLLLIIPGIWLIVPISLAYPVYYFEEKGVIDSLQTAISYVSGKWWYSFGVIIILSIILLILNSIVSFPVTIYSMIKILGAAKADGVSNAAPSGDVIFSFLTVLGVLGKFIVSIIQIPVISFLYFSLKENKTAEGALEKIQQIGDQ